MKVSNLKDLPEDGFCNVCEKTKPAAEMLVQYLRKQKIYYLRLMVYEDSDEMTSFVIKPELQPVPYENASRIMREYRRRCREAQTC